MTILYIDDDLDDIELLKEMFRQLDQTISFIAYSNGHDALDFLHETPHLPDYIFVDINMPLLSGKQILRYLKQDRKLKTIPVIMYSTSPPEQEAKELYKEGALLYLQKGGTMKAIEADITAFLMTAKPDQPDYSW